MPNLTGLLDGRRLLADTPRLEAERALFIPTDACLGVDGPPQSATGQAAILTGLNAPRLAGGHWGPKPNRTVAEIIERASLYRRLRDLGREAALLSGYPPRYFDAIRSGRRNHAAVPLAVLAGGYPLMTIDDVRAGRAFSVDFTGAAWRRELQIADAPVYEPAEAGRRLAEAARAYPFSFFEHWLTDYAGHRGERADAVALLELFDEVLGGLLAAWDDEAGLLVITSDHGNLEDLSHSHHTRNAVPTIVVGRERAAFADGLRDLTGFAPAVLRMLEPAARAAGT